ncbi:radical SAM protein [Lentzea sp. NPDC034063]|uniref:radical SAM protein n=1 Tax=unclassified Lentzea TaxID=2643253 RepID=UPI003407E621
MRCADCFVSATRAGRQMSLADVVGKVIPQLRDARVRRITLTSGEPSIHPDFMAVVRKFRAAGMAVGVCTNATALSDQQIAELASLEAHCNVSLGGFAADSHGKFRGDRASFDLTVATAQKLGAAGILQGSLCTPNSLAQNEEYVDLCEFARAHGARSVLLNPLGSMGRGIKSQGQLAKTTMHMQEIHALTELFGSSDLDITHFRFPNAAGKPLSGCEAGTIICMFTPGGIAVCPYLVFAARTPASQHADTRIHRRQHPHWHEHRPAPRRLPVHDRYQVGTNNTCASCSMSSGCGKGCPASVVASGSATPNSARSRLPIKLRESAA